MLRNPAMRAFVIHLVLYVVVTAGLAALNLYSNPDNIWFIWVLAGWGIGLAAHDLALLLRLSGRKEPVFTDRRVRGFAIHAFAYLAVNVLLLVVNLTVSPEVYWFYYPLLGWGVALAAHGYFALRSRPAANRSKSARRARTRS